VLIYLTGVLPKKKNLPCFSRQWRDFGNISRQKGETFDFPRLEAKEVDGGGRLN